MDAMRDAATLEIKVLQDWRTVKGPNIATRQKLITINVGEIWPGQDYRLPVRMVVPVNRKARGFHLTGGNSPRNLERETRPRGVNLELLKGGVGLVMTVVQEPGSYGKGDLGGEAEARFAKSLNPRYKIQYWAWPATLMRAITAAYAETEHFGKGNIAVTGGSKNGASPSMAIIHDERMTAVHATVSPIWDSPLRLCDRKAWDQHLDIGGQQRGFSGGHFGPNFNQRALNAGHTWKDLQGFARNISDQVFISRNLKALRARDVEMLFHPGTHDMVAYDMAWGGAHHPSIPVYLGANSGHGKKGHPKIERDQQNKPAFLLRHFFPDEVAEPLPARQTFPERAAQRLGKMVVAVDHPWHDYLAGAVHRAVSMESLCQGCVANRDNAVPGHGDEPPIDHRISGIECEHRSVQESQVTCERRRVSLCSAAQGLSCDRPSPLSWSRTLVATCRQPARRRR